MFRDYKIKIFGDRDTTDLPFLIDANERTDFQFNQACGIKETPRKIEIYTTAKWNPNSSEKILFDLLELDIPYETYSLHAVDISNEKWSHLSSSTGTFRFDEIFLFIGNEKIQAEKVPNEPGRLRFQSKSGPIITSALTLEFPSKHIKISELRFYWYSCGLTGYLNPSITSGTAVDPRSNTHPICYQYDGSNSFDEEVYTGEYWNEALLPGFYNPVSDLHPLRHYHFAVVKNKSGQFSSFDEVKESCAAFGMSLVYPYNAVANEFWLARLQELQTATPGLELMLGLTHTLYSTSSGALVPSESGLPLTDDVNVPNGYINFDINYSQVFSVLLNTNNQFFMDNTDGTWTEKSGVPSDFGMDATFCFKTGVITINCAAELCSNHAPEEYECVCPDDGSTLVEEFGIQKCETPTSCEIENLCIAPALCKDGFELSTCECPDEGVTQFLSKDGLSCETIDPCATGLHNCDHPSFECVPNGVEFTCSNTFECPCDLTCSSPPCFGLLDCVVPVGGADCGNDFDCSKIGKEVAVFRAQSGTEESMYRCPVGKESDCTHPLACEFDCKKLGPGWDCLKESCQSYEECSFDCLRIEDKKCPLEHSCNRNEDCCPICSQNSGEGGKFLNQSLFSYFFSEYKLNRK